MPKVDPRTPRRGVEELPAKSWSLRSRLVAAAAVVVGSLLGCTKGSAKSSRRPAPTVTVAHVIPRDVKVEVRVPVELRPIATADIGSKVLGYLDAVFVDRGDPVKKGQVLALVRPSDLPDQVAASRNTMAQTQAALALARSNHERAKQLAASGLMSQQDLQQAATALASAEAIAGAADANLRAVGVRLGETRIESPLDGVVWQRRLDPGVVVGNFQAGTILSVVRIDVMRVFISVNERSSRGVSVGKEAYVEVDALPGRVFTGSVVRLNPVFEPTTRTLDAEVQLPNKSGELRPGMYGRGTIVLATHPGASTVPASAVQLNEAQGYVYTLVGNTVKRRNVKIGVDNGSWIEITEGLQPGEEVVTAGLEGLADGSVVRAAHGVDPYTGTPLSETAAASAPAQRSGARL